MMYQLIIYLPFVLITKTTSHIPKNDSNVVIYGGHADAEYIPRRVESTTTYVTPKTVTVVTRKTAETEKRYEEFDDDKAVFIPTLAYDVRKLDDDFLHDDTMKLEEVFHGHNKLKDLTPKTTTTFGDIVFIHGKNAEHTTQEIIKKKSNQHEDARSKTDPPLKLDCKNLDCSNTVKSICGVKIENGHARYRLFLNECFYRKVNCAFNYEANRYKVVHPDKCKNVGGHYTESTNYLYQPMPVPLNAPRQKYSDYRRRSNEDLEYSVDEGNAIMDNRRRFSGRKAMQIGIDGTYCSHACPTSCTNDYQPECAMSTSFERRVFLNHCKLDLNSCVHGIIWRRRPLSECVGGKKADMQQNRAFIDWMQRVGIVDKKGRLVLN